MHLDTGVLKGCTKKSASFTPYPQHDAMFNVEQDLFLLSVVSDEGMQRVTVGNPTYQAWICWQWNNSISLDAIGKKWRLRAQIVVCYQLLHFYMMLFFSKQTWNIHLEGLYSFLWKTAFRRYILCHPQWSIICTWGLICLWLKDSVQNCNQWLFTKLFSDYNKKKSSSKRLLSGSLRQTSSYLEIGILLKTTTIHKMQLELKKTNSLKIHFFQIWLLQMCTLLCAQITLVTRFSISSQTIWLCQRFLGNCTFAGCHLCISTFSDHPNTYLRFLRREVGSFASRVLTNPKSCITLSSWRRSSWPFRRNTNSCPLLPAEELIGKNLLLLNKHRRVNRSAPNNWEIWQSDWPDY